MTTKKLATKIIEIHEPLLHRVLVKVDVAEEAKKLESTIIKVVKAEEHIDRENAAVDTGTVVDVGETSFQDFGARSVNVGDRVTFLRHAGAIRKINGEDHRVLNDSDLLTKITTKEVPVDEA
jgi:co-chaperonin GroES (HSP10)